MTGENGQACNFWVNLKASSAAGAAHQDLKHAEEKERVKWTHLGAEESLNGNTRMTLS